MQYTLLLGHDKHILTSQLIKKQKKTYENKTKKNVHILMMLIMFEFVAYRQIYTWLHRDLNSKAISTHLGRGLFFLVGVSK